METEEKVLNDTQQPVVEVEEVETELFDEGASGTEESEFDFEKEIAEFEASVNDAEFTEAEEELEEKQSELEPEEEVLAKPAQTIEENRKWKDLRVKWEAEAKEQQQQLNEIIQPYGVKDYNEFDKLLEVTFNERRMKELENEAFDKGIDKDFYIKQQRLEEELKLIKAKERARIAHTENQRIMQEKLNSDIQELKERYPTVKPEALMKNERFLDYAEGKVGNKPLADIYASFLKFTQPQVSANAEKSAGIAERSTSTGKSGTTFALTSADRALKDAFANDPMFQMTDEEFLKYKRS